MVMPNHVHCILTLGAWDYDNGVSVIGDDVVGGDVVDKIHEFYLPANATIDEIKQYRALRRRMLIPKILGKYQMLTFKLMNILRNTPGRKNWQHDYNDHVIRNREEYERIDHYIINNPRKWGEDRFNENKMD